MGEHEPDPGVAAIAAPLFNAQGRVEGAIALTAPTSSRLAQQRQRWLLLVREAAARISFVQGYQENVLQVGKKDASCEKEE
jgi:DNA-binding IclR family transcriptional regulator